MKELPFNILRFQKERMTEALISVTHFYQDSLFHPAQRTTHSHLKAPGEKLTASNPGQYGTTAAPLRASRGEKGKRKLLALHCHRITELEGTCWDHPAPAQDSPKIPACAWECCANTSWIICSKYECREWWDPWVQIIEATSVQISWEWRKDLAWEKMQRRDKTLPKEGSLHLSGARCAWLRHSPMAAEQCKSLCLWVIPVQTPHLWAEWGGINWICHGSPNFRLGGWFVREGARLSFQAHMWHPSAPALGRDTVPSPAGSPPNGTPIPLTVGSVCAVSF